MEVEDEVLIKGSNDYHIPSPKREMSTNAVLQNHTQTPIPSTTVIESNFAVSDTIVTGIGIPFTVNQPSSANIVMTDNIKRKWVPEMIEIDKKEASREKTLPQLGASITFMEAGQTPGPWANPNVKKDKPLIFSGTRMERRVDS